MRVKEMGKEWNERIYLEQEREKGQKEDTVCYSVRRKNWVVKIIFFFVLFFLLIIQRSGLT